MKIRVVVYTHICSCCGNIHTNTSRSVTCTWHHPTDTDQQLWLMAGKDMRGVCSCLTGGEHDLIFTVEAHPHKVLTCIMRFNKLPFLISPANKVAL